MASCRLRDCRLPRQFLALPCCLRVIGWKIFSKGYVHRQTYRAGEVCVQRHPRCQGDRIVRIQSHDQRGNGGREACGEDNAFGGHSSLDENLGVNHDNVSRGYERCEAPSSSYLTDVCFSASLK